MTWTDPQFIVIAICSMIASLLSILGSFLVVRVAFQKLCHNSTFPVFQRLMIALGLADIFATIFYFLKNWLLPTEFGGPLNFGNIHTCTLLGFGAVVGGMSAALCNSFLSLYFFLSVCHGKKQNDFYKMEWIWYGIVISIPLLIGFAGISTSSFGLLEDTDACYLGGEFPPSCEENPDIPCIQGGSMISTFLSYLAVGIITLASLFGFVMTVLVWLSYRKRIRKNRSHSFGNQSSNNKSERILVQVTWQAIFFSIVYFNNFFWLVLSAIIGVLSPSRSIRFPINVIGQFCAPLQGLLNAIVYFRPTYKQWKAADPGMGFFNIVKNCVRGIKPLRSSSLTRPTNTRDGSPQRRRVLFPETSTTRHLVGNIVQEEKQEDDKEHPEEYKQMDEHSNCRMEEGFKQEQHVGEGQP